MGALGILGALAGGYSDAAFKQQEEQQKQSLDQRKSMVSLLGQLASNPNVPPEHQAWAAENMLQVLNTDPRKRVKIDLATAPAITRQRSATQQTPAMTLDAPFAPPPPGAEDAAPAGFPPGSEGGVMGALPAGTPQQPPTTIPGGQATVSNVQQIAPGGRIHFMSPEQELQQRIDAARAVGIDASPRELMGLPEERPVVLNPDTILADMRSGRTIAEGKSRPEAPAKEPTTPFQLWREQNPNAPVKDYLKDADGCSPACRH